MTWNGWIFVIVVKVKSQRHHTRPFLRTQTLKGHGGHFLPIPSLSGFLLPSPESLPSNHAQPAQPLSVALCAPGALSAKCPFLPQPRATLPASSRPPRPPTSHPHEDQRKCVIWTFSWDLLRNESRNSTARHIQGNRMKRLCPSFLSVHDHWPLRCKNETEYPLISSSFLNAWHHFAIDDLVFQLWTATAHKYDTYEDLSRFLEYAHHVLISFCRKNYIFLQTCLAPNTTFIFLNKCSWWIYFSWKTLLRTCQHTS